MGENIFIDEYKNIKEVGLESLNDHIININHEICETKRELKCVKRIKKIQLKYRIYKRKKLSHTGLFNEIASEYSKVLERVSDPNISEKERNKAKIDADIYQFELALVNDETRPYEYNPKLDESILIHERDIRNLKCYKRKLIFDCIKRQVDNIATIKRINQIDKEMPESRGEKRVLRRLLR